MAIEETVDDGAFLEVQSEFAMNIVVGFARLGGHTIGRFLYCGARAHGNDRRCAFFLSRIVEGRESKRVWPVLVHMPKYSSETCELVV